MQTLAGLMEEAEEHLTAKRGKLQVFEVLKLPFEDKSPED